MYRQSPIFSSVNIRTEVKDPYLTHITANRLRHASDPIQPSDHYMYWGIDQWMDGCKNWFKNCLQQSKMFLAKDDKYFFIVSGKFLFLGDKFNRLKELPATNQIIIREQLAFLLVIVLHYCSPYYLISYIWTEKEVIIWWALRVYSFYYLKNCRKSKDNFISTLKQCDNILHIALM